MNNYDKRIQQLEGQVSMLTSLLSGKGRIVNFGKEFHIDKTVKLSELLTEIGSLKKDVEILKREVFHD